METSTSQLLTHSLWPLSNEKSQRNIRISELDRKSGLGKPCRKPFLTINDYLSITLTVACLALAILVVQSVRFAAYLGQVDQLVILGLSLSVMAFTMSKQAQLLLISLEARFGESTLQNYEAILRNDKFAPQTSLFLRLALGSLYILPLGLSASYKRFVGGMTTVSLSSDSPIHFAASGPPGLYLGNGIQGLINASSPLYEGSPQPLTQAPSFPTSYGFTMYIMNETVTAMLDTPVSPAFAEMQASLKREESRRITAIVGATYASLNSTPSSSERKDFDAYWNKTQERIGTDGLFQMPGGAGTWFGMWSASIDQSLVFLSHFNQSLNQTFQSEANAFNVYRGTCKGTWLVKSSGIFLEDARDCNTTWSPSTPHPEVLNEHKCNASLAVDTTQNVITCHWNPLAFKYYQTVSSFLGPSLQQRWTGVESSRLTIWVALVAATSWSSLAMVSVPAGPTWASSSVNASSGFFMEFPDMLYESAYDLTSTVPTMQRDNWGLIIVLCVQPVLLALSLLARVFWLHSTPLSERFGVITLLAGVERESLDILQGAAFSGRLARPVKVRFEVDETVDKVGEHGIEDVRYVLDGVESNSRDGIDRREEM